MPKPATLYRVTRDYTTAFDPSKLPSVDVKTEVMRSMISSRSATFVRVYLKGRKEQFPDNPEKWFIVLRPSGTRVQLLSPEESLAALAKQEAEEESEIQAIVKREAEALAKRKELTYA